MEAPVIEGGIGIEEAARLLGTSINTVRRRIKHGTLRAERMARPQGYAYRVFLPPGFHAPGDGSLQALVATLQTQLVEKDRQIAALLNLLHRERGNGAEPSGGELPPGSEGR